MAMNGPELKAALDELGMTQREFAQRFGLLEGSISRWANDKRAVPCWVPPVLELLRGRADRHKKSRAEAAVW